MTSSRDKAVADKLVAGKSVADKSVMDNSVTDKPVADKSVADKSVADKSAAKTAFAKKAIAIRNINLVLPHANKEKAEQPNKVTKVTSGSFKDYAKTTTAHGFPYLMEGSKARRYIFEPLVKFLSY